MGSLNIDGLNFKRTRKKNYEVYVCMPQYNEVVTNVLEGSTYETSPERPFIISGTVGETWVIDYNKLNKTYLFADGSEITREQLQKRIKNGVIDWMHLRTRQVGKELYFAAHLPINVITNLPVQTSWGDTLYANRPGISHGSGDFLVCTSINDRPNFEDMWVVNGEVFPTTYDMRAFRNIVTYQRGNTETPLPKQRVLEPNKDDLFINNLCANLQECGYSVNLTTKSPVSNGRKTIVINNTFTVVYTNDEDVSKSLTFGFLGNNGDTFTVESWFCEELGFYDNLKKILGLIRWVQQNHSREITPINNAKKQSNQKQQNRKNNLSNSKSITGFLFGK